MNTPKIKFKPRITRKYIHKGGASTEAISPKKNSTTYVVFVKENDTGITAETGNILQLNDTTDIETLTTKIKSDTKAVGNLYGDVFEVVHDPIANAIASGNASAERNASANARSSGEGSVSANARPSVQGIASGSAIGEGIASGQDNEGDPESLSDNEGSDNETQFGKNNRLSDPSGFIPLSPGRPRNGQSTRLSDPSVFIPPGKLSRRLNNRRSGKIITGLLHKPSSTPINTSKRTARL